MHTGMRWQWVSPAIKLLDVGVFEHWHFYLPVVTAMNETRWCAYTALN